MNDAKFRCCADPINGWKSETVLLVALVSVWLLVLRNRFTIPNLESPHRLVACLPTEPKSNGSGPHSDNRTSQDVALNEKKAELTGPS